MNIREKIKEAEMYHSMGMLDESLAVYETLSTVDLPTGSRVLESIRQKIRRLKCEISDASTCSSPKLSTEALSLIRQTVSAPMDAACSASELMDSAAAFQELGLFGEAVDEYGKLLKLDRKAAEYAIEEVVFGLTRCYLELHPPEEALLRAKSLLETHKLNGAERERLGVKLHQGLDRQYWVYFEKGLFGAGKTKVSQPRPAKVATATASAPKTKRSSDSKYGYLLEKKVITPEQLKNALSISKKSRISVEKILVDNYRVKTADVGKALSLFYGCPFRRFDPDLPIPVELIGRLKKAFLLHYAWVPLSWNKGGVEILVDDPDDLRKTDHIKALMATDKILFSVGIKEDITRFIESFFSPKSEEHFDASMDNLDNIIPDVTFEEDEDVDDELEVIDESSSQVVKFVDQVLITAFRKNVSDIHIEPSPVEKTTTIRFRLDGVCQQYVQVPNIMAPGIISRLKIMAHLDIAERRLPQDGKIKMKRKGVPPFELRMSTMPTAGGFEDAVLRILAKAGAMKLDNMGLNQRNLDVLKRILSQPYGLILAVGPTGSGKTTTLHSALDHINKPEIKIWTAEDPVEITQRGLRQVEAKPSIGLNFARIMRGFLRLDPDVIMIGEMRDMETASIGVEASLTGHLVFSTLHTNSAPETVTRLLDMGINPLNFSDAFLGVLAQRLVRRLCKDCREMYRLNKEGFDDIVTYYGREAFENTEIAFSDDMELYRPKGCDQCSDSGYLGRMGIHELMEGTKSMKSLIKRQAPTEQLFQEAIANGMTSLKQDGIHKAFKGLTEINEIRRVCID